jgi:branched-chain amino acid transport system permease protein
MFAFFRFLNRTDRGIMLRAVAQAPEIARILGISVTKMSALSFGLSGLLAGLTAILLGMSVGSASPTLGDNIAVKCVAILTLGSIGNLKGGLVCSAILGIVESMVMGYMPGDWSITIAFSAIVAVLLFKPEGLFGSQH